MGKYLAEKASVGVMYGGQPIKDHHKILKDKPPTVIVGIPGRILALARSEHLKLNNIKMFILDECDKMLSEMDMR